MTALLRSFLLVSLLLIPACQEPPDDPPPSTVATLPSEPTLAEQLERVKAGESTEIILESTPVTAEEFRQLEGIAGQLTRLDLDTVTLNSDNLPLLASFSQLDRLKLGAPVEDVAMAQIGQLQSLRILNLPQGQFTNTGLKQLAGLPNLELLRISSPHVTNSGLSVVKNLPALRFLHLIDLPITDEGLKHLHAVKTLESFYLDGGKTTDDGLRALMQARPDLHLHKDQLHLPGDPHDHEHADGL